MVLCGILYKNLRNTLTYKLMVKQESYKMLKVSATIFLLNLVALTPTVRAQKLWA